MIVCVLWGSVGVAMRLMKRSSTAGFVNDCMMVIYAVLMSFCVLPLKVLTMSCTSC